MKKDELSDAFTIQGKLALPYTYFAGRTGSRFLTALRDRNAILGVHCPTCDKVFVPPRQMCERCLTDIGDNWTELGQQGTVTNFTIVHYQDGHLPSKPPLTLALIRLDGADTPLVHILQLSGDSQPQIGMRVQAVFADETTNTILDIDHFTQSTETQSCK